MDKENITNKEAHCSNCGKISPQIIEYSSAGENGFTTCCNEEVCKSEKQFTFTDGNVKVVACCWADAEENFRQSGIDVLNLTCMRRIELN